jgi:ACS family hexuronate transporter-like MFS transporter
MAYLSKPSPVDASARSSAHISSYRWVVCFLLFCATTINYADRQVLSLLKPLLDDQLHWSNADFGVINAFFQAAYAVGLLGAGWWVDRFGEKIGYTVSIAIWSLAAMSHALVGSVHGFLAARVCLGMGESGNFPSAIKAVSAWFPQRERALATSFFNSGANVGAIIAPAIVPWLALRWGWQSAFILVGLAGMVWMAAWIPLYETPEKRAGTAGIATASDAPGLKTEIPWRRLFRYRQTWSFIVAKFLTDPIWWFFLIWMPDYFKKSRHLDLKTSWIHLVTVYAIVTVLSIAGGWLTGFLASRGCSMTRARKTGLLIFALCVVPISLATTGGVWTAVALIGLAGAAHQAWSANLYTSVSDMFPKSAVASVIGIGSTAGSLGGMIFPVVTGWLLDHFSAIGQIDKGYRLLFLWCSGSYLVAFLFNHLLAPKFTQVEFESFN